MGVKKKKEGWFRLLAVCTDSCLFQCRCVYMASVSVYIYIYMFWEVCVYPELASKWRAISGAVLSTRGEDPFFIMESEPPVGSCPFWGSRCWWCRFSTMYLLMDDSGGRDMGSCFHFIPDIKDLGGWKMPLWSQTLALEIGSQQSGCSQLTQMQKHLGTHKPCDVTKAGVSSWQTWVLESES